MQTFGKLNIILAVYGLDIVTENVRTLLTRDRIETLDCAITNSVLGIDGWRGQRKTLTVVYNYDGGALQVAVATEGERLKINPHTLKDVQENVGSLNEYAASVLAATYGPQDVTAKVRSLVHEDGSLVFHVDNTIFGDTWYGVAKTLVLVFGHDDVITDVRVLAERETCTIDLKELVFSF